MTAATRFDALFSGHRDELLRYLLRRCDQPADAADVLAELFVVVWRRLEDVPQDARPWLYGIARKTLANHRRGRRRRDELTTRLAAAIETVAAQSPEPLDPDLRDALLTLEETDREILALTAWEGLTPTDISSVLGITPGNVRVRLHRARGRVAAQLQAASRYGGALVPEVGPTPRSSLRALPARRHRS